MKRTPLKRTSALTRTGGLKRKTRLRAKRKTPDRDRCPQCKTGTMLPSHERLLVTVAPGWVYPVHAEARVCNLCGWIRLSESKRAEADAYRQHCAMIRARDGCCQHPGCGTTVGLEVHHIESRARRPGAHKHDPDNLTTLCYRHHRGSEGVHA